MPAALDPKREAKQLLEAAWGARGIPIDPIEIAHESGIDVVVGYLAEGVAGKIVARLGWDPVITLNRGDSTNRIRFTCAHELGHYVENSHSDAPVYEYVDKRDYLASAGTDPHEIFANQFAANLLMPEADVRRMWERTTLASLAITFRVSQDAMTYRLKNLQLL